MSVELLASSMAKVRLSNKEDESLQITALVTLSASVPFLAVKVLSLRIAHLEHLLTVVLGA